MPLRINLPNPIIIAQDGQPVTPYSVTDDTLMLSPGQRTDIIVDALVGPGENRGIEMLTRTERIEVARFRMKNQVLRESALDEPIE